MRCALLVVYCAIAGVAAQGPTTNVLVLRATIALPQIENRIGSAKFDHMDASGGRLFVACKENNTVAVIDMASGLVEGVIENLSAPQGVLVIPALSAVLVSDDGDGYLAAFDATPPYALRWRTLLIEGADNLAYDEASGLVYAAYGGDAVPGAIAVLSAAAGAWLGNISYPLGAHPECFSLAERSVLIYGSAPVAQSGAPLSEIVLSDRASRAVVGAWPLPAATAQPFANLFDAAVGHLFVAAQAISTGQPQFLVLDTANNGRAVFAANTTYVCDDLQFDAAAGFIYVSCGGRAGVSGSMLYVVQQTRSRSGVSYAMLGSVATLPPGLQLARTTFWHAAAADLYLAVPGGVKYDGSSQPAQLLVFHRA